MAYKNNRFLHLEVPHLHSIVSSPSPSSSDSASSIPKKKYITLQSYIIAPYKKNEIHTRLKIHQLYLSAIWVASLKTLKAKVD